MAVFQAQLKRGTGKEKAGLACGVRVHEIQAGVEDSKVVWDVEISGKRFTQEEGS